MARIKYNWLRAADHYYLCHYRPAKAGADRLSKRSWRFKKALTRDIHAWIDCTLMELEKLGISRNTLVMRVLDSDEAKIDHDRPKHLTSWVWLLSKG